MSSLPTATIIRPSRGKKNANFLPRTAEILRDSYEDSDIRVSPDEGNRVERLFFIETWFVSIAPIFNRLHYEFSQTHRVKQSRVEQKKKKKRKKNEGSRIEQNLIFFFTRLVKNSRFEIFENFHLEGNLNMVLDFFYFDRSKIDLILYVSLMISLVLFRRINCDV